MLGGPPGWPAPVYAQPVFVQPPPQAQWQNPPAWQQPVPQQRPAPLPPLAQQTPRREPVARAQMEDPPPVPVAPRPARLALPAPEQLGVGASHPALVATPVDWNATHAQLHRLGAVSVQMDRLPAGGHRF